MTSTIETYDQASSYRGTANSPSPKRRFEGGRRPGDLSPNGKRSKPNEATERAKESAALNPRFYTTDVNALNRLGVERILPEWKQLMSEFDSDDNKNHFLRSEEKDYGFSPAELAAPLRKELLDFFVSSLTSEFSGCVLYAELRKKGKNEHLRELFGFMARDESRHAGFINQWLKDFDMQVDMGLLAKEKEYTYFAPKFILYATYLSEKIGYARYITIYRHLEANPQYKFHPIFDWFEEWCNDEFRHGEALALMMRANPKLLRGRNLLWIRFFQLAVYATMYVRDHTRPALHGALGLDPEKFGIQVFGITQEISRQVFPVLIDIDHPSFMPGLRRLRDLSEEINVEAARGGVGAKVRIARLKAQSAATFAKLYLLPTVKNDLPAEMRVAASW